MQWTSDDKILAVLFSHLIKGIPSCSDLWIIWTIHVRSAQRSLAWLHSPNQLTILCHSPATCDCGVLHSCDEWSRGERDWGEKWEARGRGREILQCGTIQILSFNLFPGQSGLRGFSCLLHFLTTTTKKIAESTCLCRLLWSGCCRCRSHWIHFYPCRASCRCPRSAPCTPSVLERSFPPQSLSSVWGRNFRNQISGFFHHFHPS